MREASWLASELPTVTVLDLASANLLSAPVLCFGLGAFAAWLRSDLRVPEQLFAGLSIFLMLSIGLRGGVEFREVHGADLAGPLAAALALGCVIPLWSYAALRRLAGLSPADAGALAAHYGSVSAVTFAAVVALLDSQGVSYEGFAPALLAIMEVPAIVIGIGLARAAAFRSVGMVAATGPGTVALEPPHSFRSGSQTAGLLNEVLSSKSIVLLVGGLAIGALVGPAGMTKVKPFFGDLFQGALCLFLLELGRVAATQAAAFRQVGAPLAVFALAAPVLHGALGLALAWTVGMSQGGAIVLGTLAASASYIAAPAAVRLALPEANPGYYLTCSLAITFPFNIIIGLPLYQVLARLLYG
jgi:hypothetical protein